MIYSIKGKITLLSPIENYYLTVLQCQGIGYEIKTTGTTAQSLGDIHSEVQLFTYLAVREDALELYGFLTLMEKEIFLLLISVSGIGPKAALSILSALTPENLINLIAAGDYKSLMCSKGIGAKTAQRIILELKDKFMDLALSNTIPPASPNNNFIPSNEKTKEAIDALTTLGYSKAQAVNALSKADTETTVENMIKIALKSLSAIQ